MHKNICLSVSVTILFHKDFFKIHSKELESHKRQIIKYPVCILPGKIKLEVLGLLPLFHHAALFSGTV